MFQVIKSVLGAFVGVQSDAVRQRDFNATSPLPFIVAGVLIAVVLVGALILFVRLIS